MLDRETCLRAIQSKDARFDGWFVTAVMTTGIYCRPSCPARTPKPKNVEFFTTAAAAQRGGYRACKRCRPDTSPGSPEWDIRADLVGRAMRLISRGAMDDGGVAALASQLGYSVRQINRVLIAEVGAGPLAIARAYRAQTARTLVENTHLPMSEIAFAAGFSSLRTFNNTMREVYDGPPTRFRRPRGEPSPGAISLRLQARKPFCPCNVFGHLTATAVPGVETWHDGAYHRTVRVNGRAAVVSLGPRNGWVRARLQLTDVRDLTHVVSMCRWLLDLDADPSAVVAELSADALLRNIVQTHRGRRVPRCIDGGELAIRVVLGQQVSTAAAQTHAQRLVEQYGTTMATNVPGLTHIFPDLAQVAQADDTALKLPNSRRHTVREVAQMIANEEIDVSPGADREHTTTRLQLINGVGPWTVNMIRQRALGDPDVLLDNDLGVRAGAKALGFDTTPATLSAYGRRWRPWRSYATQYLWAATDHPVNVLPGSTVDTKCPQHDKETDA